MSVEIPGRVGPKRLGVSDFPELDTSPESGFRATYDSIKRDNEQRKVEGKPLLVKTYPDWEEDAVNYFRSRGYETSGIWSDDHHSDFGPQVRGLRLSKDGVFFKFVYS